jgi:hypothetical protein
MILAGYILIDYDPIHKEFAVHLYDAERFPVDRYDVSFDKLSLSRDAALVLSDEVTALLM